MRQNVHGIYYTYVHRINNAFQQSNGMSVDHSSGKSKALAKMGTAEME